MKLDEWIFMMFFTYIFGLTAGVLIHELIHVMQCYLIGGNVIDFVLYSSWNVLGSTSCYAPEYYGKLILFDEFVAYTFQSCISIFFGFYCLEVAKKQ